MAQRSQRLGDKPLALLGDTTSYLVECTAHNFLVIGSIEELKQRTKTAATTISLCATAKRSKM
jgi:hypothetical protein